MILYPIGSAKSCACALQQLKKENATLIDHPAPEVTHLMLDIPSFSDDGSLRGGGQIEPVLQMLPPDIRIIGGNLTHPALSGYRLTDLLTDHRFLAHNAAITADCALKIALPLLPTNFSESSALIIGWGRIGKCLGQQLRSLRCTVTIAARKTSDRAMASALGFQVLDIPQIPDALSGFSMLFNTVPEIVLTQEPPEGCIALELASRRGIPGDRVIQARGLPGKYAPVSTGRLIAQCILDYNKEENL